MAKKYSYHIPETYGSFTPPDTETVTDINTDKVWKEPNGNFHRSLSLSSMNTSKQFCTSHFISVFVSICQCYHYRNNINMFQTTAD